MFKVSTLIIHGARVVVQSSKYTMLHKKEKPSMERV